MKLDLLAIVTVIVGMMRFVLAILVLIRPQIAVHVPQIIMVLIVNVRDILYVIFRGIYYYTLVCKAEITCNNHGNCSGEVLCICDTGFNSNSNCSSCSLDYYGSNCQCMVT